MRILQSLRDAQGVSPFQPWSLRTVETGLHREAMVLDSRVHCVFVSVRKPSSDQEGAPPEYTHSDADRCEHASGVPRGGCRQPSGEHVGVEEHADDRPIKGEQIGDHEGREDRRWDELQRPPDPRGGGTRRSTRATG